MRPETGQLPCYPRGDCSHAIGAYQPDGELYSSFVDASLATDDGDGPNTNKFDPTPPDGYNFSAALSYADALVGLYNAAPGLFKTAGPGTVSFSIKPEQMVNSLTWVGNPPDTWESKVQHPDMKIEVKVTYVYIPEPTSLALLGLGACPSNRS